MPIERLLSPRVGSGHKIEQLSSNEYRIWTIYLLAADDYGVMPLMASKIQGADRWSSKQTAAFVLKALLRLIAVQLVRRFDVNGDAFIFSANWQEHQHIRRPRRTIYPAPPPPLVEECERETRTMFHSRKISEEQPQRYGHPPDILPPDNGNISACSRELQQQLQQQPSAIAPVLGGGPEGAAPCDVPLDVWFRELLALYPKQAVSIGRMTEDAWFEVFRTDMRHAAEIWDEMQTHLENQKRGYQWRVKGMVPKLEKWLREGLWKQLHDEHPPSAVVSEKTAHTLTAAAAFIRGGSDERS